MNVDWQTITALAVVTAAIGYVGSRAWTLFSSKKQSACGGGCSGCGSNEASPPTPQTVVPLDSLLKPHSKQ